MYKRAGISIHPGQIFDYEKRSPFDFLNNWMEAKWKKKH